MSNETGTTVALGGSFRDPAGHVFEKDGRYFRTVNPPGAPEFEFVRKTEFYRRATSEGRVIDAQEVDKSLLGEEAADASYVLEHPPLPFISYPYEWPFAALKAASLFHLDLHLEALEEDVTLSDASAYNVQFIGARPIFIDTLSFRRYKPGELWAAHRQFCEQFLNPLLLRAFLGVPHNAWYRGTQEGIGTAELRRLLPLRRKLARKVLTHVVLQDFLQKSAGGSRNVHAGALPAAGLPLQTFRKMLVGLRDWIAKLRPADRQRTTWEEYGHFHGYAAEEVSGKHKFIEDFVRRNKIRRIWDVGCNTGEFSATALESGVEYAVGFDFDQGALEKAFQRSAQKGSNFLPLFLDVANPPPSQGWAQTERYGLKERANADAVIALALVHHLAIARNVPLGDVLEWLVDLAPRGVVEFVPKEDPKVQQLLRLREDIFPDYTLDHFKECLEASAKVEAMQRSSSTGRVLVSYIRTSP